MIAYGLDAPLNLGVLEIGLFVSLVLFGIVVQQGYIYFNNCRSDPTGIKLLVGTVLLLELCHSVSACNAIYYFTVGLAGIPELEKPANSYSLSLTPMFETLITALVQGFFGYRLHLLSGRWYLSLICWVLCVLRLIGGVAEAVEGFLDVPLEPNYSHLQDTYGWIGTSALFVGAALDVFITASLCFYIRNLYTLYNLSRSEELIHRLITWTIQTGLITSVTSVTVAITFQTMKHNFVWLALYTVLAKFYSNSLLVTLNARSHHRQIIRPATPKVWDAAPARNVTIHLTRTIEVDAQTLVSLQEPEKAAYDNMAYRAV